MANTVRLKEISSLHIDEVISSLSSSYSTLIKNKVPLSKFPSVMLWGSPGVGKSEAIDQIAASVSKATGKKCVKTDVRLLLFNPIDLRGIPFPDTDKDGERVAKWLKPLIFKMDPSDDIINFLFLDEISAAPISVQAAAYQITLDKKVGEHELPKNCIVIAAGNRVTDKSVAYKMPKALSNRLMHFDIVSDFPHWVKWAIHNDINPTVMGFLSFRPDLLNDFNAESDALAYATPRSWAMVSNLLNYVNPSVDTLYSQICGLVGAGAAVELRGWARRYKDLPKVEDIFKGKATDVPKDPSGIFALTSAIIKYAKDHSDDKDGLLNSIKYALKFPKDFLVLLIEEYLTADEALSKNLKGMPEFMRLVSSSGSILSSLTNGFF